MRACCGGSEPSPGQHVVLPVDLVPLRGPSAASPGSLAVEAPRTPHCCSHLWVPAEEEPSERQAYSVSGGLDSTFEAWQLQAASQEVFGTEVEAAPPTLGPTSSGSPDVRGMPGGSPAGSPTGGRPSLRVERQIWRGAAATASGTSLGSGGTTASASAGGGQAPYRVRHSGRPVFQCGSETPSARPSSSSGITEFSDVIAGIVSVTDDDMLCDQRLRLTIHPDECLRGQILDTVHTFWEKPILPSPMGALSRREQLSRVSKAISSKVSNVTKQASLDSITLDTTQLRVHALRRAGLSCALVLLAVIVALFLVVVLVGNAAGDAFLQVHDSPLRGDPGYLIDFFNKECVQLKESFAPMLQRLEAYNKRHRWFEVQFPAREDGLPVKALYFPSACQNCTRAARVVIAHGRGSNFLHSSVMTATYLLRASGFGVLAVNLRGHGAAPALGLRSTWRHQYRDVLGAWDFAVEDRDNQLGGALNASAVGLLGFELGGLASQAAFAYEPRIPALLVHGAPHAPRKLLEPLVEAKLGALHSLLAPAIVQLFLDQAWSRCQATLGPMVAEAPTAGFGSLLARRRGGGVIGFIHAENDPVVPVVHAALLAEAAAAAAVVPPIEVGLAWRPVRRDACLASGGGRHRRVRTPALFEQTGEYLSKLCTFWVNALAQPSEGEAATRCQGAAATVGVSGDW